MDDLRIFDDLFEFLYQYPMLYSIKEAFYICFAYATPIRTPSRLTLGQLAEVDSDS
jgi:hypothetical protein